MLRISCSECEDHDRLLLRLEGDVRGEWVDELRRVCDEAFVRGGRQRRIVLDLADVLFIDSRGVLLFQELSARATQFTNCSLFVAEQLKEVVDACR